MADIGKAVSRFDVESLQEMLCFQEQLIEKLYNELDEESEASSTAATEALSMILRLQGEKAAEEMEAEQYKRFVEEKMSHAEESLCVLQELIDQKQIKIDELDHQAQDYRYKLVSMGYDDDIDDSELEYFEDLEGKLIVQSIGRCKSTPNIPLKDDNMKKDDLKDENISPKRDMNDVPMVGSISVYCEQMEKLEQRVKQIAGANNYAKLSSLPISKRSSCNNFLEQFKETYIVQHRVNKSDNEAAASRSVSPPNVLDVFEVPRADKDTIDIGLPPKHDRKMVSHNDERLERPDSAQQEAVKSSVRDEADLLKKYFVSAQRENKLRRASEAAAITCHLAISRPTTSISETSESHQPNRTSEIVEVGREASRYEMARDEELKLLHDIKEQLNLMHSEIQSLKSDKLPPSDDEPSLLLLSEAMTHFWL